MDWTNFKIWEIETTDADKEIAEALKEIQTIEEGRK